MGSIAENRATSQAHLIIPVKSWPDADVQRSRLLK